MGERIQLNEAAERLKISKNTLRRRVREWGVTVYLNPRDRRERLVDWSELQRRFAEQPTVDQEGKAAA